MYTTGRGGWTAEDFFLSRGEGLKILKGIGGMVKISESRKGDANFFRSH